MRMQPFRLAHAGHVEVVRTNSPQISKRVIVLLPVEEIWVGDRALLKGSCFGVGGHKFAGIRKRQGVQEHAIHYRKQSAVRANAQRECQHRDSAKSRILPKYTKPIPHITPEAVHGSSPGQTDEAKQNCYTLAVTEEYACRAGF